ncbi:MAG: TolC family protein [Lachnospirales bacterium]
MKNKIIATLTIFTLAISNSVNVFAALEVVDPVATETDSSEFENLDIDLAKYAYLFENEDFEYSPIYDIDDAAYAIKTTKQNSEAQTFNLSVEQAMLFLLYKNDIDFDEEEKDLIDSKNKALGEGSTYEATVNPELGVNSSYDDGLTGYSVNIAPYVSYQSSLYQYDYLLDILDDTEELLLDGYESMITQLAIADIQYKLGIDLLEKSLEEQEKELSRTQLKYELGYVSDVDLDDAIKDLDKQKRSLTTQLNNYKNFKIGVSQQLGLKETDVVNFDYDLALEPVEKTADEYVNYFLQYSPQVNMDAAERQLYNDLYDLTSVFYQEDSSTLESAEEKKDSVATSTNDSISKVMSATRQNYISLENTVTDVNNAEIALKQAKDTYDRNVLMYDLGYISKSVLDLAALTVTQAENNFVTALYSYDTDRLALEKSYLN